MVVKDNPGQGFCVVRVIGVLCGDLILQGAAGRDLDSLEAHGLHAFNIFSDFVIAEIALHHGGQQKSVLVLVHQSIVLFVHSSFLLRFS